MNRVFFSTISLLATVAALRADVVSDANSLLLDAIRDTSTAPPVASRNLALLSTAVFDAVNGIDTRYQSYRIGPAAAVGSDIQAAAAVAAHTVMTSLYTSPAQVAAADSFLASSLAGVPAGPGRTNGEAWGRFVAESMINLRSGDGSADIVLYTPQAPGTPGAWQPTGPGYLPSALPQWGTVEPWTMTSSSQFRPAGPPDLTSALYAQDYQQVYELGSATSATRTADQTHIARFWANGPGTATPPGAWNVIAQSTMSEAGVTDSVDRARLFAALNTALADAAIGAWDAKYTYDFWRPDTAIAEAALDGNDATSPDAGWDPLIRTPNFQEYVSGHSTFSGAGARVLAEIYGTDSVTFTLSSETEGVADRTFTSLVGAAEESGISRIYGGIHFNSANVDGLLMGNVIGFEALKQFQPVPEPGTTGVLLAGGLLVFLRRRRA